MKTTLLKYAMYTTAAAAAVALLVTGCGDDRSTYGTHGPDKLMLAAGVDQLSDIDIPIAEGTGFVVAGVGLRGNPADEQPKSIDIDVPGAVVQVLVYWEGQNETEGGDDEIVVDGTPVTGTLIGGPTEFFDDAWSSAYRADITELDAVVMGANSVPVEGLDFTRCDGANDCRNNGVGLLVIYDDGSGALEIGIKDGLDLAFFDFDPPLDTTVPVVFDFTPSLAPRVASLGLFASSVGEDRPNVVEVTVGGAVTRFVDPFHNVSGADWDAVTLPVDIPASENSVMVQCLSEKDPESDFEGIPASLTWTVAALSVPPPGTIPLAALGNYVWLDSDEDGIQGDPAEEPGIPGVTVELYDCDDDLQSTTSTDADGLYLFDDLEPGGYYVRFVLPAGYVFTTRDAGLDDEADSDADTATGETVCTDLQSGESDLSWDAGMFVPAQEGCTRTIGYWKNHEEEIDVDPPIWLGDAGGAKSLEVETVEIAVDVLEQHTYGSPSNGITKLYAQLLAAKLNILNGADGSAVAGAIDAADAFLADHDWNDWSGLTDAEKADVLDWKDAFDDYNNGLIGPGHCDEDEEPAPGRERSSSE